MSKVSALAAQLADSIKEERVRRGPAFVAGDYVAWSHDVATRHGHGSILLKSAVHANITEHEAPYPRYGHIVGPANEEGTHWEVELEPLPNISHVTAENARDNHQLLLEANAHDISGALRVNLTSDELVKVEAD